MELYIGILLIRAIVLVPYLTFVLLTFSNHQNIKWSRPVKYLYLVALVLIGFILADLVNFYLAVNFV